MSSFAEGEFGVMCYVFEFLFLMRSLIKYSSLDRHQHESKNLKIHKVSMLKHYLNQWIVVNGIWCEAALKKQQEWVMFFFSAATSLIGCVRQSIFEGQGLSLGIHTQDLLQLGCLRNLKAMQLCNLHTKWSGLIQNKPLNFKCWGRRERAYNCII